MALGFTCFVRLHTLLRIVERCCDTGLIALTSRQVSVQDKYFIVKSLKLIAVKNSIKLNAHLPAKIDQLMLGPLQYAKTKRVQRKRKKCIHIT